MRQNQAPKWCLGYEQTFPLMLWDDKSLWGLKKCPRIAPNCPSSPRRRKRTAFLCRAIPCLPYGTSLTRLLSSISTIIRRHWGLCMGIVSSGAAPAVVPASPKCSPCLPPYQRRSRHIRCQLWVPSIQWSYFPLNGRTDLHFWYWESFSLCTASRKLSQLFFSRLGYQEKKYRYPSSIWRCLKIRVGEWLGNCVVDASCR